MSLLQFGYAEDSKPLLHNPTEIVAEFIQLTSAEPFEVATATDEQLATIFSMAHRRYYGESEHHEEVRERIALDIRRYHRDGNPPVYFTCIWQLLKHGQEYVDEQRRRALQLQ